MTKLQASLLMFFLSACDLTVNAGGDDSGIQVGSKSAVLCAGLPALVAEAKAKFGNCSKFHDFEKHLPPLTEDYCRHRIVACLDYDIDRINTYVACVGDLKVCEESEVGAFDSHTNSCAVTASLDTVSRLCQGAFLSDWY